MKWWGWGWVSLGVGAVLFILWWGVTVKIYSGYLMGRVLHNQPTPNLTQIEQNLSRAVKLLPPVPMVVAVKTMLPVLPVVLGEGGTKEYLVLLQNNMELRPTGGFLGSYARVKFEGGFLAKLAVEDIYTPDGQLPGYVEPPLPIKKHLNSNGWFLRDSNWEADFTRSAPVIEWFFEHGKETAIDGMVAINLNVVRDMLAAVGPMYLPDYRETVTAENLFAKAQARSEVEFFPGSTQKKDFLGQVATLLFEAIKEARFKTQVKLGEAIYHNLETKQILVWIKDDRVRSGLRQLNWDGAMVAGEGDYLMIVEANLGVNKTNCCLERKISQEVALTADGQLQERLTLSYKNNNPVTPEPPRFWGGGYKNYLRVYLPKAARLESVAINQMPLQLSEVDQEVTDDFLMIGFLVNVGGGEVGIVEVNYSQPGNLEDSVYKLKVQKQSGTNDDPYSLTFHSPTCPSQQLNRNLDEDFIWETKLNCGW